MAKALLFLRSVHGRQGELLDCVVSEAQTLYRGYPVEASALRVMHSLAEDPLANRQAPEHVADVTVEIKTAPGLPLGELATAWLNTLPNELLDRESSIALVMHERVFRQATPQPICYHYLMLRSPLFTAADYCDYYVNSHSNFGMITPGIEGYSQNYIDQVASETLASTLGLNFREVTSISEMHIADMQVFLSSPAMAEIGPAAAEDEARFVDRGASIMFSSEIALSLGDQAVAGKGDVLCRQE